jgi:hypothetical protein
VLCIIKLRGAKKLACNVSCFGEFSTNGDFILFSKWQEFSVFWVFNGQILKN